MSREDRRREKTTIRHHQTEAVHATSVSVWWAVRVGEGKRSGFEVTSKAEALADVNASASSRTPRPHGQGDYPTAATPAAAAAANEQQVKRSKYSLVYGDD